MSHDPAPIDLVPMLGLERAAFIDLLRGLSAADWERPTECPAWTVKGIALHILGDDLSLLTRQRDASTDSLTLFAMDHPGVSFRALLDGFNDQWVNAATFISNALVIELLGLVGEWSETFYRDVGLDTRSLEPVQLFAETEPSPYWQVIAREYAERFIHQSQIRRAIGAVPLDGELVTAAALVHVHLLAAWMRDDTPAVGTTLGIDLAAGGSWLWERTVDRWIVIENAGSQATEAQIAVQPDSVVGVLSRGIARDDVASVLTITGDTDLARSALAIISGMIGRPEA